LYPGWKPKGMTWLSEIKKCWAMAHPGLLGTDLCKIKWPSQRCLICPSISDSKVRSTQPPGQQTPERPAVVRMTSQVCAGSIWTEEQVLTPLSLSSLCQRQLYNTKWMRREPLLYGIQCKFLSVHYVPCISSVQKSKH
jgi:hypothetical protein